MRILLSLLASISFSYAFANDPDRVDPVSLAAQIDEAARLEMKNNKVPSLQIAIGQNGALVFERAYGLADIENNVSASSKSRYRTASISKWMTATAAMILVERQLLDLDAPIQTYCPQFPEKAHSISTNHLLSHTSGIRHYADYEAELEAAKDQLDIEAIKRRRDRDELGRFTRYTDRVGPLENFKDDPLKFSPGSNWLYSSYGYRVLGCVLEGAAKKDYSELMEELVFTPAGMAETVADDAWAITPNRVAGYQLPRDGRLRRADMRDVSENLPAGGHLSTASDIVHFAMAFHGEKLVTQEAIRLMTAKSMPAPDQEQDFSSWQYAIPSERFYGLGLMYFPHETEFWIGHTGQQDGASTIVVLIPAENLAIAVLTNLKGWAGYLSFVRKIRSIVAATSRSPETN